MYKEIHSVDEFEKECYDVLNQDIETIKNEIRSAKEKISFYRIEEKKLHSTIYSLNEYIDRLNSLLSVLNDIENLKIESSDTIKDVTYYEEFFATLHRKNYLEAKLSESKERLIFSDIIENTKK